MSTDENHGDFGILLGLVRGIRRAEPNASITVISAELCAGQSWNQELVAATRALDVELLGTPSPSRAMHGGHGIAWSARLARSALALWGAKRLGSRARRLAHPADRTTWDALVKADVVLAKGGSYLYSHGGLRGRAFVWRMLYLLTLSQALGHATCVMGVTVGPLQGRGARRAVGDTLSKCRRVYLREKLSENYVAATMRGLPSTVARATDMAFLLEPSRPPSVTAHQPVVAVTIRVLPFAHSDAPVAAREHFHAVMLDALAHLLSANQRLQIVLVIQVAGDAEPSRAMLAGLSVFGDRVTIAQAGHPDDLMRIYDQASVLVATRLHSTIFAALSGTPSVHIVSDVHKGFGIAADLGLDRWCIAADAVDCPTLTAHIAALMDGREAITAGLHERVTASLRRSAESALDEALALSRPDSG